MALYIGEAVAIRAVATNPFTEEELTGLTGTVETFNPTKDPKNVPGDRTTPHATHAMTYDANAGGYVAYVPTTGYVAGKWSYRVHLTGGAYDNWEYGSFSLKE